MLVHLLLRSVHVFINQGRQKKDLRICLCQKIQVKPIVSASFLWIMLCIQETAAFAYLYHLKPARVLCFYLVGGLNSEEEVFMASLICSMDDDCEKLLICKMDTDCVKSLCFDSETANKFDKHSTLAQEFDWNACTIDASRTYMMGKSPFPSLDVFIEDVASIGNISGKIRSWYWFSEYGLMIYSMSRNRYCERIGRQHKSNHVMYVVDVRRGNYYQKCHDPDCRGYRSPLRPVPNGVIPDPAVFLHLSGQTELPVDTASTTDQSLMDSCKKEWWTEAIRLADQVESIQRTLDVTGMAEKWEEDDDWWRAVERTASQTESKYSSQA